MASRSAASWCSAAKTLSNSSISPLLPEPRNRGIGTALLGELIEESRKSQATLRLQVLRNNEGAIRLYRRLGFTTVSEDEMRYEMKWNQ